MTNKPRRSSLKKNKRKGKIIGTFLVLFSIIMVSILIYLNFQLKVESVDQNTLCSLDKEPASVIAILIDATDSIPERTAREANIKLKNIIAKLPVNSEIAVYEISDKQNDHIRPIIKLCKPIDGSSSSVLTSNPEHIKYKFNERFFRPLEQSLESLIKGSDSKKTPLIEAIQSASIESFLPHEGVINKKLIVVSDFLQHSKNYSFYSKSPSFSEYLDKKRRLGLGKVDLTGVEVTFFVIPRSSTKIQRRSVIKFWREFIIENNASIGSNMEPLS